MIALLTSVWVLIIAAAAAFLVIKNLYYICQPNEVLIFAGGTRMVGERAYGYRLLKGGASLRVPLFESVSRMDLTNMIIELSVSAAYSKGGIPLHVDGVANVKVAGEEPIIHNAIERLLGRTRDEIRTIARETLEGNVRGVLATLTPQEVNADKIAFARALLDEAEDDLQKIGLVLDTLQIQNISDDRKYLDSIGRKQRAELIRDARIAEAQAQAESVERSADNEQNTALAQIEADMEIAKAEAKRRIADATTKRAAMVAEAEAETGAMVARNQAEVAVQTERIEQVRRQLDADVVAPAEAGCKRKAEEAKGQAARIIEDGKAQVEGLRELIRSWKAAGDNARDIFLLQKLEPLVDALASTVQDVHINSVTVIDAAAGGPALRSASFLEQLKAASGLDVAKALTALGGRPGKQEEPIDLTDIIDVPD